MSNENKTSPRAAVIVPIVVAIIGCCATILGAILPKLLDKPTPVVSFTATQSVNLPVQTVLPTNVIIPSATVGVSLTNIVQPTDFPTATSTAESALNNVFSEKFDDNSKGWLLNNSTRLSQGKLAVTVNNGDWIWLTLPGVKVDGDFYIQAEMLLKEGHACYSAMGFALGEADISQHSFLLSSFGCSGGRFGFYQNNSEIFSTKLSGIGLDRNVSYVLALELKNGLYTLYINGKPTDSTPLTPDGNDIGIYLWRPTSSFLPADSTFFIDNIVLKNKQ